MPHTSAEAQARAMTSLFAHIHNDPLLKGSVDLEGNTFSHTIGFLNEYISTLASESIPD